MLMQIGQKPESDFGEPIGMLEDCHKRIIHFLATLTAVAEATGTGPLDESRRKALEKGLRYFRDAAPKHTADEEESLFPRLRLVEDERVRTIFAELDTLEKDHESANAWHSEVEVIGNRWLVQGALPEVEVSRFKMLLQDLSGLYRRHIAFEEAEVFSLAKAFLPEAEKLLLGEEMALRRGIVKSERFHRV